MGQSREKQLEAALAFVLILLIISLAIGIKSLIAWTIIIGFLLGAFPFLLQYFYFGWSHLLKGINFATSKILLTLVFVIVVLPLSFFVRRSKKRTIVLRKENRKTMFTVRNHLFRGKELENPW